MDCLFRGPFPRVCVICRDQEEPRPGWTRSFAPAAAPPQSRLDILFGKATITANWAARKRPDGTIEYLGDPPDCFKQMVERFESYPGTTE
jgi:hypothetical protein